MIYNTMMDGKSRRHFYTFSFSCARARTRRRVGRRVRAKLERAVDAYIACGSVRFGYVTLRSSSSRLHHRFIHSFIHSFELVANSLMSKRVREEETSPGSSSESGDSSTTEDSEDDGSSSSSFSSSSSSRSKSG